MMAAPNVTNLVPRDPDRTPVAAMLAGLGLMVVFAVLAHRDYVAARNAIKADPSLRGAWLVENAWWMVYLVLIVPVLVGFALAMWLIPRLG